MREARSAATRHVAASAGWSVRGNSRIAPCRRPLRKEAPRLKQQKVCHPETGRKIPKAAWNGWSPVDLHYLDVPAGVPFDWIERRGMEDDQRKSLHVNSTEFTTLPSHCQGRLIRFHKGTTRKCWLRQFETLSTRSHANSVDVAVFLFFTTRIINRVDNPSQSSGSPYFPFTGMSGWRLVNSSAPGGIRCRFEKPTKYLLTQVHSGELTTSPLRNHSNIVSTSLSQR